RLDGRVLAAAPVGAFALWTGASCLAAWRRFDLSIDFAYFTQASWLIGHFKAPFVSYGGINLLGDHAELTFFGLSVLGRPFPTPLWLLTTQTGALVAAAFPLAAIARRQGLAPAWVVLGLAVFLFHPGTQNLTVS